MAPTRPLAHIHAEALPGTDTLRKANKKGKKKATQWRSDLWDTPLMLTVRSGQVRFITPEAEV